MPGTSNHGWGLAVDLDLDERAQAWMRTNAERFGFFEEGQEQASKLLPAEIDRAVIDTIVAAARRPRTASASTPDQRFIIYTSGVWVLGTTSFVLGITGILGGAGLVGAARSNQASSDAREAEPYAIGTVAIGAGMTLLGANRMPSTSHPPAPRNTAPCTLHPPPRPRKRGRSAPRASPF